MDPGKGVKMPSWVSLGEFGLFCSLYLTEEVKMAFFGFNPKISASSSFRISMAWIMVFGFFSAGMASDFSFLAISTFWIGFWAAVLRF